MCEEIFKKQVELLVKTLEEKENIETELKNKQKEFEEANSDLFSKKSNINNKVQELKEEINLTGLKDYEKTQNKNLYGGLAVKVYKKLEYDENKALDWAKEHNLCLALDKKAFEKVADQIDFVTKKESPKVTFPKQIKLEGD